jgi:hypothetical protein
MAPKCLQSSEISQKLANITEPWNGRIAVTPPGDW